MTSKVSQLKKHNLIIIDDDCELDNLLEPYKHNEYLPIIIIDPLIKLIFNSGYILHEYSPFHKIIKIKIDDLLNAPITNWQYNRPADLIRCNDISRYIYNSKKCVDTMFYLSFNNKTRSFDIIDGIHRYTSLKIIKEQNSKVLDLLKPNEFGNNNDAQWLYESYIIVNTRINASDSELIDLFKSLNKSNPIPELYIRDVNKEKREIIETIANNWQVKYNSHFSSSSKPNKPNINRDRFIDLLDILYDRFHISEENKSKLEEKLNYYNADFSNESASSRKITQSIKQKCSFTGCWLFAYTFDELVKIIK
jgi:hypothetical protein